MELEFTFVYYKKTFKDIFVGLDFKNDMYIETFKKQSFYNKHFTCFINEEFPTLEMRMVCLFSITMT